MRRIKPRHLKVMGAIHDCGDQAYGLKVMDKLNEGRRFWFCKWSIGGVYATAQHLEEMELVTSTIEPGGPERGYRQKRRWQLTDYGFMALKIYKIFGCGLAIG